MIGDINVPDCNIDGGAIDKITRQIFHLCVPNPPGTNIHRDPVQYANPLSICDQPINQMRADKAGAADDQNRSRFNFTHKPIILPRPA